MNDISKTDELEAAIEDAMEVSEANTRNQLRHEKLLSDAINPDTGRTTRSMMEQIRNIIGNLEGDIRKTEEVRFIVNRRIADLHLALEASKATLSVLEAQVEKVDKPAKPD